MAELLTWEKVRAWAASKPTDDIVGVATSLEMCPFATCLKDSNPGHTYEVDNFRIQVDGEGRENLPLWASLAIDKVDRRAQGTPITASTFLAILDDVEAESEVAK